MVRGALKDHPEVCKWFDYIWKPQVVPTRPGELPTFLETAYKTYPDSTVVGTMTHCGGLEMAKKPTAWADHWQRLYELHDKRVLIVRRNSLRRFVSVKIAQARNAWSSASPRRRHPAPLTLDLAEYLAWAAGTQRYTNQVRQALAPCHEVAYADLCTNWTATMRGVYDYLGLTWNDPQPTTFQQETRPIRDILSNYDAVVAAANSMLPNAEAEAFLQYAKEDET